MRTREKIRILKAMRRHIKTDSGFCRAYYWSTPSDSFNLEDKVIAIGLKKPKRMYRGDWWYNPNNTAIRLRKIDELIKQLSK